MAPSNEQKILNALAALKASYGTIEAPKSRVRSMAEVSPSTYPSLLSRMAKKGMVEYGSSPETIKITDAGLIKADPQDVAGSNLEVQRQILETKLKGPKPRRIFEILMDGKIHSKDDIMKAVDCTNPKTFGPLLSRELKKPGYIHYPSKGKVQLADMCYPFGRDHEEEA